MIGLKNNTNDSQGTSRYFCELQTIHFWDSITYNPFDLDTRVVAWGGVTGAVTLDVLNKRDGPVILGP